VQQKEGKTNGKTGRQEDSHILAILDVKWPNFCWK
jgi:hypothetical protein